MFLKYFAGGEGVSELELDNRSYRTKTQSCTSATQVLARVSCATATFRI